MDERTYYDYSFSRLVIALKARLSDEDLGMTEEGLRQYYADHQETRYRLPDAIAIEILTVPCPDGDKGNAPRQMMALIREAAAGGQSLAQSATPFRHRAPGLQLAQRESSAATARDDSRSDPALWAAPSRCAPAK